jgi:YfiH family protein
MTVPYLTPTGLPITVKAGFFTRQGGVSQGVFASLNMSAHKGDTLENVRENRRRICESMEVDPTTLVTLNQVHGDAIITVEKPLETPTKGDALVTQTPGLLLGIQTADCVPILLADTASPWIAAIHAGWKGAHLGIIEKTVAYLEAQGAHSRTLVAAIGPCIWQENYEVTAEFYEHFDPTFFKPSTQPQRWYFDLPGYVTSCLKKAGVLTIIPSPANTFADETRFFSNRRHFIRQEEGFGGFLSAIVRMP